MINKVGLAIFSFVIFLIFYGVSYLPATKKHAGFFNPASTENHPPAVKIIAPKNNSSYARNALVAYEISVSDKEDGDSKFGEINPKEIFLEVRYLQDTLGVTTENKKQITEDPPGLALIKKSNCMNCHSVKTKLIGPSFGQLLERYHQLGAIKDTLVNHILNGSKGRWGEVQMPSNNKLSSSEASEVLKWIFKNASDSTADFLAGNEGAFRMNPPASCKYALLTASYTDHGSEEQSNGTKGEDVVLILLK